jgi:hypothetical protein
MTPGVAASLLLLPWPMPQPMAGSGMSQIAGCTSELPARWLSASKAWPIALSNVFVALAVVGAGVPAAAAAAMPTAAPVVVPRLWWINALKTLLLAAPKLRCPGLSSSHPFEGAADSYAAFAAFAAFARASSLKFMVDSSFDVNV